ncbi:MULTISPECIES: hypothetical protein [unclassified Streptomyces]|uniref:hypothetical protein n=1 Tax=unclassified Streptomyces TaxID=2593676 RepID=UPI000B31E115|nr:MULTISPECIES: hypothetical protein [unclassified Streptomyces]
MRIRSALTASVLAAGILLGGAGAALANDGVDIEGFSAGHKAFASNCSSFAGVPAKIGPLYADNCEKEGEKEWAKAYHLGA